MAKTRRPASRKTASPSLFSSLSPTVQDLLCAGLLYVICLVIFRGIVFNNGAFATEGDTAAAEAYQHVGNLIRDTEGVDPLWMPVFFSGMPTFGNVAYVPHNISYLQTIVVWVLNFLFLKGTWTWLVVHYFLGGLLMFLLARVLNFSRVVALFAAITFMLSPYAIGLADEGHGSKLMALSYLPLVFLMTHLLFERRDLISFGLLAASVGTLLLTNHMQIVYYVFLVVGCYVVFRIVVDYKRGVLAVAKPTALFIAAMAVGLCISSYVYLSVYDYAQYSMRGGGTAGSTGGLMWDYATNWSWHPTELITLLIPGFFGMQLPYYWGNITPWTNSTVYVGLLPVLLSVVALMYKRNTQTVFFAVLSALVILLAFGKYIGFLYEFLFNVLPFFNKFRAPAMILHLLPFSLGILGAYGLTYILEAAERTTGIDRDRLVRAMLYGAAIAGGIAVLALLLKSFLFESLSGSMFLKDGEPEQFRQQYGQQAARVIAQVKQTRFDMFWKDLVKFGLLAAASCGVIFAFLKEKVGTAAFGTIILAILVVDLWTVATKYVTPKPSAALEQGFRPDATVSFLKQQPGNFRVFPVGQLFMDNTFPYHGIASIGGYSPAKLRIYQTMLDSCLERNEDVQFPWNMNVINMLNVRYLVVPGRLPENRLELVNVDQAKKILTYANREALPKAWYVRNAVVAETDHATFAALNAPGFNAAQTAVLYRQPPSPFAPQDSTRLPEVLQYTSRRIVLKSETASPALLVLSEVYYPSGWKAFIDGRETEILRTNYVLRSVVVPGGTHEVVFSFDPPLYRIGWVLSNAAWAVTALCIVIGLWLNPAVRQKLGPGQKKPSPEAA
jgi:Bacterial membrane protein YfhO